MYLVMLMKLNSNTDKSDVDCLLSMELIDFTYAEYQVLQ